MLSSVKLQAPVAKSAKGSRSVVSAAPVQTRKASVKAQSCCSKQAFKNQLEALRSMSTVVADTGEISLVKKFKPVDCTTNPSLVYKAVQMPEYKYLVQDALSASKSSPTDPTRPYSGVADALAVNMGCELLKVVPGRVSTEVDATLSYDTKATVSKALHLIDLYGKKGIDPSRVYIKIASTWEGIEACRELEKRGINCNMTLLFSFAQAAACADAGATLISPFVGRILDWHKNKTGKTYTAKEDPGVVSVQRIYNYYKTYGYKTIVMAASFRNVGEILELAGCDNITISPQLLGELEASSTPLNRVLSAESAKSQEKNIVGFTKKIFDDLHNADQMAVDKLKEGINGFSADQKKLEELIAKTVA
nr:transaldolase (TALC) [Polytomella parva]|mmetsp:Transcript_31231/g.56695  ORF Transcript_31231/g.56695 Transcript_31231/m.56695 type:complete len:364 (-) Transcript_31231:369-1460(-)